MLLSYGSELPNPSVPATRRHLPLSQPLAQPRPWHGGAGEVGAEQPLSSQRCPPRRRSGSPGTARRTPRPCPSPSHTLCSRHAGSVQPGAKWRLPHASGLLTRVQPSEPCPRAPAPSLPPSLPAALPHAALDADELRSGAGKDPSPRHGSELLPASRPTPARGWGGRSDALASARPPAHHRGVGDVRMRASCRGCSPPPR